jgi:hypothetical protein
MPPATPKFRPRICATAIVMTLLGPPSVLASVQNLNPADYASHRVTCESPVRLTHDCSIWQGATRPIAFADYRMTLAAGSNGRTILISQLRHRPDHNGNAFRRQPRRQAALEALRHIGSALEDQGIRLERMQAVRRGRRVAGYFLEFSDNAYDYLKKFTVLESEYWLPSRRGRP